MELLEIERRLGLFALGIGGHGYHVRPDEELRSHVVAHRRGMPISDGETLYLPASVTSFERRAENAGAYRLMALHQLGYEEFGTFEFSMAEAERRFPQVADRPLREEAARESDLSVFFRHFSWPALARALFSVLEGARIDARLLSAYPGARRDWERCRVHERATRPLPDLLADAPHIVEALIASWLGHDSETLRRRDATGSLDAMLELAGAVTAPDADVYATAGAVLGIYALLAASGLAPPIGASTVATDEHSATPDAASWPAPVEFHGEPASEWRQREVRLESWENALDALEKGLAAEMDHAETQSRGRADGSPRPSGAAARDQLARRVDMERSAIRQAFGREDRPSGPSFLYDEWDMLRQRYLRGWCRLYELSPEVDGRADAADLLARVAPHRDAVRRRFSEIRPHTFQRVRRVVDGDELDFDELIDFHTETKRGQCPDARVYRRKDRIARDVAAAFLLDLSASTDDPVDKPAPPEPMDDVFDPRGIQLRDPFDDDAIYREQRRDDAEPSPRRIIDVLRESLLLMAGALEHYRDLYGIYGFSGYGRDCVEYYVVKELGERFAWSNVEALAALRPRRSTRMGPPIRHSAWKLKRAATGLRVLIMVSDGFPQDCDYGPDRADHEYGVLDTAKALDEAQLAGIETFCVTVDRSGHDYLKRMCREDRYMVIDEIEALPDALTKVYQKLTAR